MSTQLWNMNYRKEKIKIHLNRTLKLNNVLIRDIEQDDLINENKIQAAMQNYILSKGGTAVGPLITYCTAEIRNANYPILTKKLMIQLTEPVEVEEPYEYQDLIRVERCLYSRFSERLENLPFAYHKLRVYAFENDLKLSGESYTISLNAYGSKITADIFMPFGRI